MNNLDEDIKIVEKLNEFLKTTGFLDYYNNVDKEIQAIDNVLKELETYKKIAEKLAELLLRGDEKGYICDLILGEHCVNYKTGKCTECIIDWARKEVNKYDQN